MRYIPCGNCMNDIAVSDLRDQADEDAIVDFIRALVGGDIPGARILVTRALGDVIDTTRILKLFADHARSQPRSPEKTS